MTSTLPDIIDAEYLSAPVSGPEDIRDPVIKKTVEALVLVQGNRLATTDLSIYTPTEKPQDEDPRGRFKRGWDNTVAFFLPRTKKVQLAKRREQEKQIAYAQGLYQWADQNRNGVVASLRQLRTAHDGISAFVQETESGIQDLQDGLTRAEQRAAETVSYIKRLDSKLSSPEYRTTLESSLGREAAEKTMQQYRAEKEACTAEIAQLGELRSYVDSIVAEFSGDAAASRQSLGLIAAVMRETIPLRLRLEVTLRRYQGLTAHQIDAAQATQSLAEMRSVVGELDKGIRQVHCAFIAQAETFLATSDLPYEPALPYVPLLDAPKGEYEK